MLRLTTSTMLVTLWGSFAFAEEMPFCSDVRHNDFSTYNNIGDFWQDGVSYVGSFHTMMKQTPMTMRKPKRGDKFSDGGDEQFHVAFSKKSIDDLGRNTHKPVVFQHVNRHKKKGSSSKNTGFWGKLSGYFTKAERYVDLSTTVEGHLHHLSHEEQVHVKNDHMKLDVGEKAGLAKVLPQRIRVNESIKCRGDDGRSQKVQKQTILLCNGFNPDSGDPYTSSEFETPKDGCGKYKEFFHTYRDVDDIF